MPGCYTEWLARAVRAGQAVVRQPYSGEARQVDLAPDRVHTMVLLSKDFGPLLRDEHGLRTALEQYEQVCCQLTVTGLGGSRLEPGVPPPEVVLAQLGPLVAWLGAKRLTVRFDPIVHWVEGDRVVSNLDRADAVLAACARAGLSSVRLSFATVYAKMKGRGVEWHDPSPGEKLAMAADLVMRAKALGLSLLGCCQPELAPAGVIPAGCIDGAELSRLHPRRLPAPTGKDRGQRAACRCTPSVDIGSYDMRCPNGCLYCYANPRRGRHGDEERGRHGDELGAVSPSPRHPLSPSPPVTPGSPRASEERVPRAAG
ncbi:MAG: DUF1848 family protein [Anaerolineae bacterium]|nr:DUF1848 family protein [Anaerolineae bacterium]